jgi:hypothetical protein
MSNHWWWRPGWKVGTRFYAWHLTLEGQDAFHALADRYGSALAGVSTLDVIPREWRHLTVQGLGHAQDVDSVARDRAIEAVRQRVAALSPITSTFRRAAVFSEAVALPPSSPPVFAELREAIRDGITDAWGRVPERADGFRAHVSVAYSNAVGDGRAIRAALDMLKVEPAAVTFDAVSLIRMHRDRRLYEWTTVATVPIGSE